MAAAEASFAAALEDAGLEREKIEGIAGTGSGMDAITLANVKVNDKEAMARGARYAFPNVRTVVDVGAEESRAAKLDAGGAPVDFVVNEKCAAGAGIFIETMARLLEVPLEAMGALCLQSEKTIPMNAQCVIFAEAEVVGLIHANTPGSDISRAVHDAMAGRIATMIRRIGVTPEVMLMGGVAYNPGLIEALKRELQLKRISIPPTPEFGAAVGAALFAAETA
jgi:benzoyl-CoA reductase subunit D